MRDNIKKLVGAAQHGDEQAFNRLYKLTYDRNFYLINKMVGSEEDTLDILQDTYVKIYQGMSQFVRGGKNDFIAWTAKIASNTAIDYMRKRNPILFSQIQTSEEEVEWEDDSIDSQPERAYERQEIGQIVQELLNSLSEEQRVCILMYYLQEMSIKEIAAACHCPENTVKSRLYYGRKKIKRQTAKLRRSGIVIPHVPPLLLAIIIVRHLL